MAWLNEFYSAPVAVPLSLACLAIVSLLSWRKQGRQVILALTLFLYVRYLLWRGIYTLNTADWSGLCISSLVLLAEAYGLVQLIFFTFQAWKPLERKSPPIKTYRTVDVFVTVVNEPLDILRRTLIGCTSQDYPADKYKCMCWTMAVGKTSAPWRGLWDANTCGGRGAITPRLEISTMRSARHPAN